MAEEIKIGSMARVINPRSANYGTIVELIRIGQPKNKNYTAYDFKHKNRQGIMRVTNLTLLKQMAENKMEQVAALFGKKLGEVFSVEFVTGSLGRNRNFASCCYFKADGLFCEDRGPCETMLNNLLIGKSVIVEDD